MSPEFLSELISFDSQCEFKVLSVDGMSEKLFHKNDLCFTAFKADNKTTFTSSINVFELQSICKRWLYSKDYLLDSRTTTKGSCFLFTSPISEKEDIHITFQGDSEPLAVFGAGEYIFNMEKNNG